MKTCSKLFKRAQAWVLTIAMLLPILGSGFVLGVSAADETTGSTAQVGESFYEGSIVADNYGLTEDERAILKSGLLLGKTYKIVKPNDESELVSVDKDTWTTTAKEFTSNDGAFVWVPALASYEIGDETVPVKFVGANGEYTATTEKRDGVDAFSVKVVYELRAEVDEATQQALLSATKNLLAALDNYDALYKADTNLATVTLAMSVLSQLADGMTYDLVVAGQEYQQTVQLGEEAIAAVEALEAEMEEYDGFFKLSNQINAYKAADLKVRYMMENDLSESLATTAGYINTIYADETIQDTVIDAILASTQPENAERWKAMKEIIRECATALDACTGEDKWALFETQILKDEMSDKDWESLNSFFFDANNKDGKRKEVATSETAFEVKNPLLFGKANVQFNMDMFNLNVNVVLKVYNNVEKALTVYDTKTIKITLADGADLAKIEAAIAESAIENVAIAAWGDAYDAEHFNRTTPVVNGIPDGNGLYSTDVTYTVTYIPNKYAVDWTYAPDASAEAYYGQILTLPTYYSENGSDARAYDYTVAMNGNAASYYEGSEVTVEGDVVINRTEGKAYDIFVLGQLATQSYFGGNNRVMGILTSPALKVGKEVLKIRVPDPNTDKDLVSLVREDGEHILTVEPTYASGYKDLKWVAQIQVMNDNEVVEGLTLDANNQMILTEVNYTKVVVTYKLVLDEEQKEATLNELLKLPAILVKDAADQASVLDRLADQKDTLTQLDKTKLGAMKGMVSTLDIDESVKNSLMADIDGLIADCFDGQVFRMNNLIDGYANGGLTYYYKNNATFQKEMKVLCDHLESLLQPEKRDALVQLLESQNMGDYADKIDGLKDNMGSIRDDLSAPNAAIDVTSDKLSDLVNALVDSTAFETPATRPELYVQSASFTAVSPNRVQPSVNLVVGGSDIVLDLPTFNVEDTLTKDHIDVIKNAIEDRLSKKVEGNEFFYKPLSTTLDKQLAALYELVGEKAVKLEEVSNITVECELREFTVVIPTYNGEKITETITLANMNGGAYYSFKLNAEGVTEGFRCDFTVPGKEGTIQLKADNPTASVVLTRAEIEALYADKDSCEVIMEIVDLTREKLIAFVETLNDSSNSTMVQFLLTEGEDGYSIIMKVKGAASSEMAGAMAGMAMGFATSGYGYVAMADQPVMFMNEANDLIVSIQSVYDAIMYSGFSTDDLIAAFDENGVVKHQNISGQTILVGDKNAKAGGKLIATTMSLGNDKATALTVDFHINVDEIGAELLQVRNLFANQLANRIKLVCENGKIALDIDLPQKAYEVFVASLLITGTVDIRTIDAEHVNMQVGVEFMKHFLNPIFSENASLEAVAETLNMFGFETINGQPVDFSGYEKAFDFIRKQYHGTKIEYTQDSFSFTKNPGIKGALASMGVPSEIAGMIQDDTVTTTISARVQDFNDTYEAIYVDLFASEYVNKIGMTQNVAARLNQVNGASIIVLLSDVEGDLVVPAGATTVLNLNGFTVDGNIKSNGNLTIVDSSMMYRNTYVENGKYSITGTVTGPATILGGRYENALAQNLLKDGYEQNADGFVGNKYFNFVKDEAGNMTIELDAGILSSKEIPNLKALVMDLVVDMLFNGYTTNKICINDNLVYKLEIPDFVGLYTSDDRLTDGAHTLLDMVSKDDLFEIVNTLMDDLTDFGALKEAVASREPIISYKLTTASWDLLPAYIPEGKDYFTMGIVSGNEVNRQLNIKIVGEENEIDTVASMLGVLDEVAYVDVNVDMSFGRDGKNLKIEGDILNHVVIDFSSNPKYTILMAVILADGVENDALAAELTDGIKTYYAEHNIYELNKAFDKVSITEAINAMENISANDSIGRMLENLQLNGIVGDDVKNIGNGVMKYARVMARALRKVESEITRLDNALNGIERTFGSLYRESEKGYGLAQTAGTVDYTRELFKGYSVTLEGHADLKYIVKLFRYTPTIDADAIDWQSNPNIAYLFIDNVNMTITMDYDANGITVSEFAQLLLPAFRTSDGALTGLKIVGNDGNVYLFNDRGEAIPSQARDARSADETLVGTGFTVAACTTGTPDGHEAYTAIILGDIDGDGRTTGADPQRIAVLLTFGTDISYTKYQEAAMDINRDGAVNISDAQAMAVKFVYWKTYSNNIKAKA